jgi:hypothetical protein
MGSKVITRRDIRLSVPHSANGRMALTTRVRHMNDKTDMIHPTVQSDGNQRAM